MRELVEGKNTIGRTAAVLKKPYKAILNLFLRKGKVKFHPVRDHESTELEKRYSSTLSLTSALDEGGWSTPHAGRFNPGMTRYPLCRRLGGPRASLEGAENFASTGVPSPDRPARNESLNRLSYRGPTYYHCRKIIQYGPLEC